MEINQIQNSSNIGIQLLQTQVITMLVLLVLLVMHTTKKETFPFRIQGFEYLQQKIIDFFNLNFLVSNLNETFLSATIYVFYCTNGML